MTTKIKCWCVYCVREKLIANSLFEMIQEDLSKKKKRILIISRQLGVEIGRSSLNLISTISKVGDFEEVALI